MLIEANLLIEGLSALWLTGSVGLALSQHCRRFWPNLHVRYASPDAMLIGARRATHALLSERPPLYRSRQSHELWLCAEGRPPERLISAREPSPSWCSHLIDASHGPLSLWLRAEGLPPTLWASHPPFHGTPRRLELAYEGPELTQLAWLYEDGNPVTRSEGRWTMYLAHHPQALSP